MVGCHIMNMMVLGWFIDTRCGNTMAPRRTTMDCVGLHVTTNQARDSHGVMDMVNLLNAVFVINW